MSELTGAQVIEQTYDGVPMTWEVASQLLLMAKASLVPIVRGGRDVQQSELNAEWLPPHIVEELDWIVSRVDELVEEIEDGGETGATDPGTLGRDFVDRGVPGRGDLIR